MKTLSSVLLLAILFITIASAQELGNSPNYPVKASPITIYQPPAVPRQGGDTIADATPIPGLPFFDTGSTMGYLDNYDEECPFDSSSPDVVYRFEPDHDTLIRVDLCGSLFDTKTYIYDVDLNLVACNDDYYFGEPCGWYVSRIQWAQVYGGEVYYLVVDGYGGSYGEYILEVTELGTCSLECPPDAVDEGEPPLVEGYVDAFNGGCNSPEFGHPFQAIDWTNDTDGLPPYDGQAWLCGTSGWYQNGNVHRRDTDWFRVFALQDGVMEFTVIAEYPCNLFKLAPTDCETMMVDRQTTCDCWEAGTLAFPVTAGEEIWLWVGPTTFEGPVAEFPYFMTVTNNTFEVVPAEAMSWGRVKGLYR